MNMEIIYKFFLWCTVINYGLLMLWFLIFAFAHNHIYHLHSKWFKISEEQFNATHYTGLTIFKIAIFLFNFTPFIVLHILSKG